MNSLNVPNRYIFKCERAAKVENGGEYLFFFDELGPFFVFIPYLTEKISKFQIVMSNFQLLQALKVTGVTFFSCLDR